MDRAGIATLGLAVRPRMRLLVGVLAACLLAAPAVAVPAARASGDRLNSVACPSATQCTATDDSGNELTFDPATGAARGAGAKAVMPGGLSALTAVSCPSETQCTGVSGSSVVTFDPASGQTQRAADLSQKPPGPNCPAYDPYNPTVYCYTMQSIACPGVSECTGGDETGKEVTFDPHSPAAARWSTIDDGSFLEAVACSSGTQCTVVAGGLGTQDTEVTYDPTTGRANPAGAKPVGGKGIPFGLTCVSANQCTAVNDGGTEVTFDPTTGIANPGDTNQLDTGGLGFQSVSCASATQCTAVGTHAVTFNPTTGVPNAAGRTAPEPGLMYGVACVSARQCTAVNDSGDEVTFDPTTGKPNPVGVKAINPRFLSLKSRRLKIHHGLVRVPLSCQIGLGDCQGTLSIVTLSRPRILCTVRGRAGLDIAQGVRARTVRVPVSKRCLARLRAARGHHIRARFSGRLKGPQKPLAATVTLRLG